MNLLHFTGKLPVEQVERLLLADADNRQSVVFLPFVSKPDVEAGDYLAVVSNVASSLNDGEKIKGLLRVTHAFTEDDGINPLFSALSVRPLDGDEIDSCRECGGRGFTVEYDGPYSQSFGCEECCGIGMVPVVESEGTDHA